MDVFIYLYILHHISRCQELCWNLGLESLGVIFPAACGGVVHLSLWRLFFFGISDFGPGVAEKSEAGRDRKTEIGWELQGSIGTDSLCLGMLSE